MKVVRLSALLTGHLYPQKIFLVIISVRGQVDLRDIVAGRKVNHRESKTRPSGLKRSVSTDCVTACPIFLYDDMKIYKLHWLQRNFKQCPCFLHV